MTCPDVPRTLYEINTRVWLAGLGVDSLALVPDATLDALAARGVDLVWLMGVWTPSAWSTRVARTHQGLAGDYRRALSDVTENDVVGSPYAVADYTVSPRLGGDTALAALRTRLRARGMGLLLDLVPNHTACDHPWVTTHPTRYVQPAGDGGGDAFSTGAGERVMHGRDPYFPPWTDTAQLDYRRISTRAAMTQVLVNLAAQCDGVRCDMAMLALGDVFARTWDRAGVRSPSPEDLATGEFWSAALDAVHQQHPGFLCIAEAYWGTETRLQRLGFDATYDKTLYDHLGAGNARAVNAHLGAGRGRQHRSVRFLENHDEDRAAAHFPPDLHPLAALLALTLPGIRLVHEGQLEGARTRLPVQLGRRRSEAVDEEVLGFYARLLAALGDPVLRLGGWRLLTARAAWPGNSSHEEYVVYGWDGSRVPTGDGHRLLVVNLATHRAQCRVTVSLPRLAARTVAVEELLAVGETPAGDTRSPSRHPVYLRDGDALGTEGLYLDLPARTGQLLAVGGRVT